MNIRYESLKDREFVYALISECFETKDEEKLVRMLHADNQNLISLVAEKDGQIAGQIILSKMSADNSDLEIYGLAPMCVAPEYQRSGVGSKLIERVEEEARKSGVDAIFVLGHPAYYRKFGFVATSEHSIKCEYDVPDEVFMVMDISKKLAELENQTVYYAEEFGKVF